MLRFEHLLGRTFVHGRQDCYSLIRQFYADNFNILLRNYARPDDWWSTGGNLYMDLFRAEGFELFHGPPQEWEPADLVLMAIRSTVVNHAGVFVENGQILHHLLGGLSRVDPYKGLTRNSTMAVLRHRDVKIVKPVQSIEALDVLPPSVRRKYLALLSQQRERESGNSAEVG